MCIGFASTATKPIQDIYIHYDCGCVLSEKGELLQKYEGNAFSIPSVYIAYLGTFGALVSLMRGEGEGVKDDEDYVPDNN